MRCPRCRGFEVCKEGGRRVKKRDLRQRRDVKQQRYRCRGCGKWFILGGQWRKGFTFRFLCEVVRRYFDDRSSYRIIQRRGIGSGRVGRMTAWRMVVEAGRNAKTSLEIARELVPFWSGYLVVDGKSVRVGREEWSWFLGLDVGSRDLVHEKLMEGENRYELVTYFRLLRDELRYRVKGIVSDLNPDIGWAIRQVWPAVPHQLCTAHMLRWVDHLLDYRAVLKRLRRRAERVEELLERLGKRPGPGSNQLFAELREAKAKQALAARQAKPTLWLRDKVEKFLLAATKSQALATYEEIRRRRWRYESVGARKAIHSLEIHKEQLLTHFNHPKLSRSTNLLENVIRNFERRLKTIESFRHNRTAEGYLRLMAIRYRCTPFTDCRASHRSKNGKSPLALAHTAAPKDWVVFSQSKKDPP